MVLLFYCLKENFVTFIEAIVLSECFYRFIFVFNTCHWSFREINSLVMGLEFLTIGKSASTGGNDENFESNVNNNCHRGSNIRLLIAFFVFIFYLACGAVIFNLLESSFETNYAKELREYLSRFIKEHPCLSCKYDFPNFD